MKKSEPIFIDKKSKTGILMLHGFTSSSEQFKELSSFMADKGFNVYAPVIAGHGTSPEDLIKTNSQDWADSAKKAYLKLKENSKKIFVIGNSFGSNLALWLAKEFNNEPAGIVSLGAPIILKYHRFIKFRLATYGRLKKYYSKPPRVYKTDYTDMSDETTYPVIPIKSLFDFFRFIKKETIPNLRKVKVPVFVAHSDTDPVVHPKSATFIYRHLGSPVKKIYWFESNHHSIVYDKQRSPELFQKILDFVQEVNKE